MGMAPLYSASASPGPSPAMRRVGTPTICQVRASRWASQSGNLLRLGTRYLQRQRDRTRKSYISAAVPLWHIRGQTSPCRGRVLHVAPFGYTFLEVAPLSLSRGSPATRWLRGVRLDCQCATRLGKLLVLIGAALSE